MGGSVAISGSKDSDASRKDTTGSVVGATSVVGGTVTCAHAWAAAPRATAITAATTTRLTGSCCQGRQ